MYSHLTLYSSLIENIEKNQKLQKSLLKLGKIHIVLSEDHYEPTKENSSLLR